MGSSDRKNLKYKAEVSSNVSSSLSDQCSSSANEMKRRACWGAEVLPKVEPAPLGSTGTRGWIGAVPGCSGERPGVVAEDGS